MLRPRSGDLYRTTCTICGRDAAVKYYLWVKLARCPECGSAVPLFPGYLLAEAVRHPKWVFACSACLQLVELDERPGKGQTTPCPHCGNPVGEAGSASHGHVPCTRCGHDIAYPAACASPPEHLMWAIEYHCEHCKPTHRGRFFKTPSAADRELYEAARQRLAGAGSLPIPEQAIPAGDETTRLLRWGYRRYRDMFNDRQLLGLGTLFARIQALQTKPARSAADRLLGCPALPEHALPLRHLRPQVPGRLLRTRLSGRPRAVREQPPRHPRRRLGRLLALRREVPPRQGLLSPALREPRQRERASPSGDPR